jgi:hypothetical protein
MSMVYTLFVSWRKASWEGSLGRNTISPCISWVQWHGVAQHGVSAFALLSIETGSGAVLTGAFANELRSSLDIVFAKGGRSPLAH